ncbi:hypothetical protein SADUNF_SadunfUnG0001700 [Salix dunnii]|uniref:Transmembrane protein n=1 Tax=Salix dunnii TaxID=1413687 RepID=A0A835IZZ5_9ROSI|nr:hypothetical protein SADUNF_SadunfUnG0001700 [Salix dunnii]
MLPTFPITQDFKWVCITMTESSGSDPAIVEPLLQTLLLAREQLLQLIMSSPTTAMDTTMYTVIHGGMNSVNVALLTLLQLKYQNKEISPFEEHGTIILLYILTSVVYSTVLIALLLRAHQLQGTLCLATLEHICLLSGALACDLLLLILAPPFGYFLLAFCGVLILVKALLRSYQQIRGHDVAAISERARDLIRNVSRSMDGVLSNQKSTDQGSGDHNTSPTANV